MKTLSLFGTLFLFTMLLDIATARAQCKIDYSNYNLVLDENFDDINSPSDLSSRWQFHPDDPNWGWGKEYYESSQVSLLPMDPNNPSQGNIIRLTAQKITPKVLNLPVYGGPPRNVSYVSGMLQSTIQYDPGSWPGNIGFKYGMFEMRAKLPNGDRNQGDEWPAFWLTSGPTEIDILDQVTRNQSKHLTSGLIDWNRNRPSINTSEWTVLCDCNSPIQSFDCIFYNYCGNVAKFNSELDYPANSIVKYENKIYTCANNVKHSTIGNKSNVTGPNLSEGYNIYGAVWTPTEVTFFLNGRAQYTVPYTNVPTHAVPAIIIASMQVNHWGVSGNEYNMDIDYIRIYKPKGNNYTLPYTNQSDVINHDLSANISTPAPMDVAYNANSLAVNPGNKNEIFYRGAENHIHLLQNVNGSWTYQTLQFNDGDPDINNSWVGGDVRYNSNYDLIVYAGKNNRINVFGRSTTIPGGFYHGYLRNNWWIGDYDKVSTDPGSIQIAEDGDIFFKGVDAKLHRYYLLNGIWTHMILPSNYSGNDFVKGDIVIEPGTKHPHYKGADNRVQAFWIDNNGNYNHSWSDNDPLNTVSSAPTSMVYSQSEGLFYIGTDHFIHNLKWNPSLGANEHFLVPHNYGSSSLGLPNADYARGSIAWDENYKWIYYGGFDGRIQRFGKSGNSWWHDWLDDYWTTVEYNTFDYAKNDQYCPSITLGFDGPDRSIYYVRNPYEKGYENESESVLPVRLDNQYHISYFKYEQCIPLEPQSGQYWPNAYKSSSSEPGNAIQNTTASSAFEIFPNPAMDKLHIKPTLQIGEKIKISVLDITGRVVINESQMSDSFVVDVSSLYHGMYMVLISMGNKDYHYKFTKD